MHASTLNLKETKEVLDYLRDEHQSTKVKLVVLERERIELFEKCASLQVERENLAQECESSKQGVASLTDSLNKTRMFIYERTKDLKT